VTASSLSSSSMRRSMASFCARKAWISPCDVLHPLSVSLEVRASVPDPQAGGDSLPRLCDLIRDLVPSTDVKDMLSRLPTPPCMPLPGTVLIAWLELACFLLFLRLQCKKRRVAPDRISKPAIAAPTPIPILALTERPGDPLSPSMSSSSPMPSMGLSDSLNIAMMV
jgi:hypothetical protein